jgi:hypothetical protein
MSRDGRKFGKSFTGDMGEMMTKEEFQNKIDQLFRGIMAYVTEIKGSGEKQLYGAYAGEDLPPGLVREIATLEKQMDAMRTEAGKRTIYRKINQTLRRYGWTFAKFPLVQLPWSPLRREKDEMERIPAYGTEELEGALEDD